MKKNGIDFLTIEQVNKFFNENPKFWDGLMEILEENNGELPAGGIMIYNAETGESLMIEDDINNPHDEEPDFSDNAQDLKKDAGKPRLDLVPLEGLVPMARVREFALSKYGVKGIEAWRDISDERLLAALLRHLTAYQMNPDAVDEESGLPAIYHVEANAIFLAIKAFERFANVEKKADPRFVKNVCDKWITNEKEGD